MLPLIANIQHHIVSPNMRVVDKRTTGVNKKPMLTCPNRRPLQNKRGCVLAKQSVRVMRPGEGCKNLHPTLHLLVDSQVRQMVPAFAMEAAGCRNRHLLPSCKCTRSNETVTCDTCKLKVCDVMYSKAKIGVETTATRRPSTRAPSTGAHGHALDSTGMRSQSKLQQNYAKP